MKKMIVSLLAMSLASVSLAACGGNGEEQKKEGNAGQEQRPEPVTLTVFSQDLTYTEETLNALLIGPLKEKLPHIKLNYVSFNEKGRSLQELVAAGMPPDLYLVPQSGFGAIAGLGLTEDVSPLAKQSKLDLSRFQPSALEAVKTMSDKGELYALPYEASGDALHYNKDIFDKFAVPYPKDGMTWDDAMELAKKLSRNDNGVQHRGLGFDGPIRLAYTLSMLAVDAKTNKVTVDNAKWREAFTLGKQIYSIPNNMAESTSRIGAQPIASFLSKTLAMIVRVQGLEQLKNPSSTDMNWDIAQAPSFANMPHVYSMPNLRLIGVTKTSKHKEAALQVIETLTSDEVQLKLARTVPLMSPLVNPAMREQFAGDIPELKGKNVQALFKSQNAQPVAYSIYHGEIYNSIVKTAFIEYVEGKTDLNTALRGAQEAAERKLADLTAR